MKYTVVNFLDYPVVRLAEKRFGVIQEYFCKDQKDYVLYRDASGSEKLLCLDDALDYADRCITAIPEADSKKWAIRLNTAIQSGIANKIFDEDSIIHNTVLPENELWEIGFLLKKEAEKYARETRNRTQD